MLQAEDDSIGVYSEQKYHHKGIRLERYSTSLTDDPKKAELTHEHNSFALVTNTHVESSGHYLSHLIFRIKSLILSCGQGGCGLAPK